jgi:hypothetical protein
VRILKASAFPFILAGGMTLLPISGRAQSSGKAGAVSTGATALASGLTDFDFEIGTWKTHIKTLQRPLTGSTAWRELDGTTVVQKIGDGQAHLLELDATGPDRHLHAINLRGEFHNGRGEFYDQETYNGKAIFVRFIITVLSPNACHFEQAFSTDGGKTWEVNWIADDTRIK